MLQLCFVNSILHRNRFDQLLVINKTLLFVQDLIWRGSLLLVVMWRLARFSILEDTCTLMLLYK